MDDVDETSGGDGGSGDASVEVLLRRALAAAAAEADAAHGEPVADEHDLDRRIRARANRRSRVAGAAAAALLVVGLGAGVVIGASWWGDQQTSSNTASLDGAAGGVAEDAGAGSGEATATTSVGGSTGGADEPSPTEVETAIPGLDGVLVRRTLADGTVLEVRREERPGGTDPTSTWCTPVGSLTVAVAGPGPLGEVAAPLVAIVPAGRMAVTVGVVGDAPAQRWVVVAQAPGDVVTVRAVLPDGTVDDAPVDRGVAVLSTTATGDVAAIVGGPEEVSVEGVGSDGAVVARWTGDRAGLEAEDPCRG